MTPYFPTLAHFILIHLQEYMDVVLSDNLFGCWPCVVLYLLSFIFILKNKK
jgi:hypothetical protein